MNVDEFSWFGKYDLAFQLHFFQIDTKLNIYKSVLQWLCICYQSSETKMHIVLTSPKMQLWISLSSLSLQLSGKSILPQFLEYVPPIWLLHFEINTWLNLVKTNCHYLNFPSTLAIFRGNQRIIYGEKPLKYWNQAPHLYLNIYLNIAHICRKMYHILTYTIRLAPLAPVASFVPAMWKLLHIVSSDNILHLHFHWQYLSLGICKVSSCHWGWEPGGNTLNHCYLGGTKQYNQEKRGMWQLGFEFYSDEVSTECYMIFWKSQFFGTGRLFYRSWRYACSQGWMVFYISINCRIQNLWFWVRVQMISFDLITKPKSLLKTINQNSRWCYPWS